MTSIERPSRRVRESATAMRYWGLRILPSRVSLILTAMVEHFSCGYHAAIQRLGQIARPGFASRVYDRTTTRVEVVGRTGAGVAAQTAAHSARTDPEGRNPASVLQRRVCRPSPRDPPG